MRWKAGSLLIGVVLLFSGLTSLIAAQADAEDDYRRSLELTATLTAARLDASIAGAATTAILVPVGQSDRMLVAVMILPEGAVIPRSVVTGDDGDSYAARLAIDAADEWWAPVTGDGPLPVAGRERLSIALQLSVGALILAGVVVAVVRDHRGLRRRATTDALTGLPNRTEFERRATRTLLELERDGRGACLIVVDLDRFKAINDTIGHAAGDQVLRDAGTRLAAAVRASDLVGRWGGDEFVLLLAGISDPLAVPERTAAIAECLSTVSGAAGSGLTASVGAAVFPLHGRDLETLLAVADRAMYDAKPRPWEHRDAHGEPEAPAVPWRT